MRRSTRLKLSRHIVRSDRKARVLIINIELCTLHLRETTELEKLISFCLWGDGCAASLVTAEPHGILLESFHAIVAAERRELMSWHIRDDGFDMVLSGQVPGAIRETLRNDSAAILGGRPRGRDRSVGGPSRRPIGARRGRAGARPWSDGAGRIARRAAAERQHVVGDGHVRDGRDVEGARPACSAAAWPSGRD